MKTIQHLLLIACLSFLPLRVFCDWNDTKGIFKGQKDLEGHVGDKADEMATVAFNGKLWNFVSYNHGEEVTVRILDNTSKKTTEVYWDCSQKSTNSHLKDLHQTSWQPAPVVFNETLYLFVYKKDGTVGYSTFDLEDDNWTKVKDGPSGCRGNFMSACVIYDKLYLLARDGETQDVAIYWTTKPTDSKSWKKMETGATVGYYNSISAISKTYFDITDSKIKSKLQFAYVTDAHNVRFAEYNIDTTGQPMKIRNIVIDDYSDYTSVALSEGSIEGDKESKGFCTQAFMKMQHQDNGYCRHRILRYQLIDGDDKWTLQERNLVKQNYLWASKPVTLTVANFPVYQPADSSIRQFMCVVYRGYDDWNNPLNCAWAETDHWKRRGHGVEQRLSDAENIHYIGYIEGPPPYYLNPASANYPNDKYVTADLLHISAVRYNHFESETHETKISYDVGAKISGHFAGFKAEVAYTFGQKFGHKTTFSMEQSLKMFANASEMYGLYIGNYPVINWEKYAVYDTKDTLLYPTYYFFISRIEKRNESVKELKQGLVFGDPRTYMNRGIPFSNYKSFSKYVGSASWLPGLEQDNNIKVDTDDYTTSSHKASIKLEKSFLHVVGIEVEGSFEYETTSTTTFGDEISCLTALNDPVDPTDVAALDYDFYWICPTDYETNWWLKEGTDPDQNTWCLTYEVSRIEYKNGTSVGKPRVDLSSGASNQLTGLNRGSVQGSSFSLAQNYPNPFQFGTTIKYEVGTEKNAPTGAEESSQVKLVVYDLSGKTVATLINQRQEPGNYEVRWDASGFSPGLYYYSLDGSTFRDIKKMILLK
jgi:hypothetical protein